MTNIRMKLHIPRCTLLVFLALLPTWAAALESDRHNHAVLDQYEAGSVNWTEGTVIARGFGVPPPKAAAAAAEVMAQRAAMAVALRNLLEVIQGIHVDAETVVETLIVAKDEINTRVHGVIRNAKVLERQVHSDGSVELRVAMPLWGKGSLTSTLLEEKKVSQSSLSAKTEEGQYTGVVFDARGLGLQPVMFPRIVGEHGQLVYGPDVVSRVAAEDYGFAQYVLSEEVHLALYMGNTLHVAEKKKPTSLERVGPKPLRIKGLGKLGAFNANMMISNADAKKIRQDRSILRALNGAKVIIITDPLVAGVEGHIFDPQEMLVLNALNLKVPILSPFQGDVF